MSILEFFTSKTGLVSFGGNLDDSETKHCHEIIKTFANMLSEYAKEVQIPASILKIKQASYLQTVKYKSKYYFLFVDAPGRNTLIYSDVKSTSRFSLSHLLNDITVEKGDVIYNFSIPTKLSEDSQKTYLKQAVRSYIEPILVSQMNPEVKDAEETGSFQDISTGMKKFYKNFPAPQKTAFIMMQISKTKQHDDILNAIKNILKKYNIIGMRADDTDYMDDLFANIKVYMNACTFGIAVFERITKNDFNPNVSLEVGYMLGKPKKVLLLKDSTLKTLPTDLTGKLYKEFDTGDIENTIPPQIEKWLADKSYL